ncbi:UGSC family (seleno)protein [Chloroflexota bacterium]
MDQLELERLGIPTVTVVTSQFAGLAKTVALSESVTDMCFTLVPHPMGMIPKADIEKKALDAFPEILKVGTEWQPSGEVPSSKPAYPAERFQFTGTPEEVNKLFFERGWSLGIPVIPPTPEGLDNMLKGTNRKPDEVFGQIPPRMATLTVELVAIHALMAGCKPEYMPLLIAALEGLLAPEVNWRGSLATTGTTQFVVIVNGPVIKELEIANEQGAAGKGHHPNGSIGYAINLLAYAVGGSKPPSVDKSTLASPADFVCWVFGENEDRLPPGWEPLHVDRGFKKSDSVATVVVSYPPLDNIDHWSVTPQEHVRWWRHLISPMLGIGGPCNPSTMKLSPIVAIGPEHAQLIASAGWSKDDFRQALWEQARIPMSAWPADCRNTQSLVDNLGPVTPESMIPITFKPEQFSIVIAGGDGKHSHYFAPFPGSFTVSKLVTK